MILNHVTALTLLLVMGWYNYHLFSLSTCTFKFLSFSFTQVTRSLHTKGRMRKSFICKKLVSVVKKGDLRSSHYGHQRFTISLKGRMDDPTAR